jgi:hypothetical protein
MRAMDCSRAAFSFQDSVQDFRENNNNNTNHQWTTEKEYAARTQRNDDDHFLRFPFASRQAYNKQPFAPPPKKKRKKNPDTLLNWSIIIIIKSW